MDKLSQNILLLAFDDDPEQLEVFDVVFKERGVQHYELCYTKADFFSKLTNELSFCIIDHRLQDTNGIEVTLEVKKRNKGNFVMIYSAIRDFDVAVEYINIGADRFVKKSGDVYDPDFILSLRIGFIEAQERIIKEKERLANEKEKEQQLDEHASNLIDLIARGNSNE